MYTLYLRLWPYFEIEFTGMIIEDEVTLDKDGP